MKKMGVLNKGLCVLLCLVMVFSVLGCGSTYVFALDKDAVSEDGGGLSPETTDNSEGEGSPADTEGIDQAAPPTEGSEGAAANGEGIAPNGEGSPADTEGTNQSAPPAEDLEGAASKDKTPPEEESSSDKPAPEQAVFASIALNIDDPRIPDFYIPMAPEGTVESALFSFTDNTGTVRYRIYGSYGETTGFFACELDGSNPVTGAVINLEDDAALLPAAEISSEPDEGAAPEAPEADSASGEYAPDAEAVKALQDAIDALPPTEDIAEMDPDSDELSAAKSAAAAIEAMLSDAEEALSEAELSAFEAAVGAERIEKYAGVKSALAAPEDTPLLAAPPMLLGDPAPAVPTNGRVEFRNITAEVKSTDVKKNTVISFSVDIYADPVKYSSMSACAYVITYNPSILTYVNSSATDDFVSDHFSYGSPNEAQFIINYMGSDSFTVPHIAANGLVTTVTFDFKIKDETAAATLLANGTISMPGDIYNGDLTFYDTAGKSYGYWEYIDPPSGYPPVQECNMDPRLDDLVANVVYYAPIKVSKTVTGTGAPASDTFSFNIKVNNANYASQSYNLYKNNVLQTGSYATDASGNFTLHGGEYAEFADIKATNTYAVTESLPSGSSYVLDSSSNTSGTVTNAGKTASFTNRYAPGKPFSIEKKLTDATNTAPTNDEFSFAVKIAGSAYANQTYKYYDKNGTEITTAAPYKTDAAGKLKLKAGEKAVFAAVTVGAAFTVTEDGKTNYTVPPAATGAIGASGSAVVMTNIYNQPTTTLNVSKVVKNYAAKDRNYEFEIEAKDRNNQPLKNATLPYTGSKSGNIMLDANGKGSFTLKGGENIAITKLHADGKCTISEKNLPTGYTASVKIDGTEHTNTTTTGEMTLTAAAKTVVVTNDYQIIPTGLNVEAGRGILALSAATVAVMIALFTCFTVTLNAKRRRAKH